MKLIYRTPRDIQLFREKVRPDLEKAGVEYSSLFEKHMISICVRGSKDLDLLMKINKEYLPSGEAIIMLDEPLYGHPRSWGES